MQVNLRSLIGSDGIVVSGSANTIDISNDSKENLFAYTTSEGFIFLTTSTYNLNIAHNMSAAGSNSIIGTGVGTSAKSLYYMVEFAGVGGGLTNTYQGLGTGFWFSMNSFTVFTLYRAFIRFGIDADRTGIKAYVGLHPTSGLAGSDASQPSSILNCYGIGYDTTDSVSGSTPNWFHMHSGGGTPVRTDTGIPRVNGDILEVLISFLPDKSRFGMDVWRVTGNPSTGSVTRTLAYSAVNTTDIPTVARLDVHVANGLNVAGNTPLLAIERVHLQKII